MQEAIHLTLFLFQSFKTQAYLKIETDNSTVPPTKIYVLGARAEPEINKAEMMNLSKKVFQHCFLFWYKNINIQLLFSAVSRSCLPK
jgi:hypothetical protein